MLGAIKPPRTEVTGSDDSYGTQQGWDTGQAVTTAVRSFFQVEEGPQRFLSVLGGVSSTAVSSRRCRCAGSRESGCPDPSSAEV